MLWAEMSEEQRNKELALLIAAYDDPSSIADPIYQEGAEKILGRSMDETEWTIIESELYTAIEQRSDLTGLADCCCGECDPDGDFDLLQEEEEDNDKKT